MEGVLKAQLAHVEAEGWLPFFQRSAYAYGFDTHLLLAVASRETNIKNILGDGGHGHGIMQVDDRSFPAFCSSHIWKVPQSNIDRGAFILGAKRDQIKFGQGRSVNVRGFDSTFIGKVLTADELLRTAVAAYNVGMLAYYDMTKKGDPDLHTTGHDYSKDVMERAAIFKRLL